MRSALAVVALAAVLLTAGGCRGLQDLTAWITGAPTNAQIEAEQAKLDAATRKAQELEITEEQHRAEVAKLKTKNRRRKKPGDKPEDEPAKK